MALALPGSSVSTDQFGTTVTLPRTFKPSSLLSDRTPANLISPSSPFSHIFFSAMREPQKKILDARTVIICVDGACAGNGTPAARAGVGIYFGPGSPHNASQRITDGGAQTSQRAEILAATTALRKAIVLLTDSQYVVGAMTEWVFGWKDNAWKNTKGKTVENKEFQELDALIEQLEEDGLDVKFWLVGREHNEKADELAKAACV
ncbi:ribonuclease H-like domain-containing protein [Mycena rebaudengoi]|nr:ribonuclease H-like domain-containing protein [Mycena rebaudengoi]